MNSYQTTHDTMPRGGTIRVTAQGLDAFPFTSGVRSPRASVGLGVAHGRLMDHRRGRVPPAMRGAKMTSDRASYLSWAHRNAGYGTAYTIYPFRCRL